MRSTHGTRTSARQPISACPGRAWPRSLSTGNRFSAEILGDHFVSDATFAEALAELGDQGIVDLIGSLGNFSMLAMLLNACQVHLQAVEPPFPDVRGYEKVPDHG